MTELRFHGYWRSTASYRVRIALNYKELPYEQVAHNLLSGDQRSADYLAIAPQGLVPALEADGRVLTQSLAIIEWLEERWPTPPLLPADPADRAAVRAMALLVACDIHPLNNLRVLNTLRSAFGADKAQVLEWIAQWIGAGFEPLEQMVARHGGSFAFGDVPTLADVCLVPQYYSAQRYGVDLAPYPAIGERVANALRLPAFAGAHPDRQPDVPPKTDAASVRSVLWSP